MSTCTSSPLVTKVTSPGSSCESTSSDQRVVQLREAFCRDRRHARSYSSCSIQSGLRPSRVRSKMFQTGSIVPTWRGSCPGSLERVEQLRAPEVPDRVTVAREHVEHGDLVGFGALTVVVTVVRVLRGRQHTQSVPAAFACERLHVVERRLRDRDEVHERRDVIGSTVELVEQRRARGARALGERQVGGFTGARAGTIVAGHARET